MDGKQAQIAGVECLILRIGFVGEVGYEIHFPSAYGEHVWDALMEAGKPHGLRPFGLEPQRILRLQKLHILVGQDTDSESTPFGAAMPWIVKLDKEQDFIGKWALEHYAEQAPASALVGFTMPNGDVPTEGAVVLDAAGHARRPGHQLAPLAGARTGRSGWRGCPRRSPTTAPDHDLRRGPHAQRRDPDQAVLRPRRRGAALVNLDFLTADGRRRGRGALADGAAGARPPAPASRSATAGTSPSSSRGGRAGVTRWAGPTSRTWARSSSRARRGHRRRRRHRASLRHRGAPRRRLVVPADPDARAGHRQAGRHRSTAPTGSTPST